MKRDKLEDCYSKNGVSLTAEMMEYFQKYPEEFEIKRMDTSEE